MKVLQIEKRTDEKWVNLYAATYEHKGRQGSWLFASRKEQGAQAGKDHLPLGSHSIAGTARVADAVHIVAVLREQSEPAKLVLLKEFRVPVGDYVHGLPAGLVEPGEKIEDTIRREMREETGLEVTAITRITAPLCSSAGLTDETTALAFVEVRRLAGIEPEFGDSEDIQVLFLDHPRMCQLCEDNHLWTPGGQSRPAPPKAIVDARAWMIMYMYQRLGDFI